MKIPHRILIPFSGQKDSIDLVVQCVETYTSSEIFLLFVKNIGIRETFDPPINTARALTARMPTIRALIVADAHLLQVRGLASFAPELAALLGVRSFCVVCQSSLLLVAALISKKFAATLVFGPRESLGADVDGGLRGLSDHLSRVGVECVDTLPIAPESGLNLRISHSQRCALSTHHHEAAPVDNSSRTTLEHWMKGWAETIMVEIGSSAFDDFLCVTITPLNDE